MRTSTPLPCLIFGIFVPAARVAIMPSNIIMPNPLPEYTCVTLPSWTNHRFSQPSCRLAFDYARNVKGFQARQSFDFFLLTFLPSPHFREWKHQGDIVWVSTTTAFPIRHRRIAGLLIPLAILGTCTVAIVMLEFFEELPAQPLSRARFIRAIATFYNIFLRGQFVIENCV